MDTRLQRSAWVATRLVPVLTLLLMVRPEAAAAQWLEQDARFSTPDILVNALDAVDENVAWILAGTDPQSANQEFSRTTDGGATWIPGTVPEATGYSTACVMALDASNAWAGLDNPTLSTARVYKTTDGGVTWVHQSTAYPDVGSFVNVIYFFDANNGITMGDPTGGYLEIYTTTDGGGNWTRVPSANIPPLLSGELGIYESYDVRGDTIWFGTYADSGGRVFRSTDRGVHWTAASPGIGNSTWVTDVAFRDASHGMIAATNFFTGSPGMARTTDGGDTWTLHSGPTVPHPFHLSSVPGTGTYVTTNFFFFFAAQPGSAYTPDDGDSWTLIDQDRHGPVDFVSPTVGWSGGLTHGTGEQLLPPFALEQCGLYKLKGIRSGNCAVVDKPPSPTKTTPTDFRTEAVVVLGGVWKWAGPTLTVAEAGLSPSWYVAHWSYPNPFNPSTTIQFSLAEATHAVLHVYNTSGRLVRTLVNAELDPGPHAVQWDGRDGNGQAVTSGVYVYELASGAESVSGRMTLAK